MKRLIALTLCLIIVLMPLTSLAVVITPDGSANGIPADIPTDIPADIPADIPTPTETDIPADILTPTDTEPEEESGISLAGDISLAALSAVTIWGLTLDATNPYYHNGAGGAVGTVDNVAANYNAYLDLTTDPAKPVLYLNGLNVVNCNYIVNNVIYYGMSAMGGGTIDLTGNNTVSTVNGINASSIGIAVSGNTTIRGTGSLTGTSGGSQSKYSYGIYHTSNSDGNTLTINSGTVTGIGDETSGTSNGIGANKLKITGGTVKASTVATAGTKSAISINPTMLLTNYVWRTGADEDYKNSRTTSYKWDAGQTYVEIAALEDEPNITNATFIKGQTANAEVTVGPGVSGFDASNFLSATLDTSTTLNLDGTDGTVADVATDSFKISLKPSVFSGLALGGHTLAVKLQGAGYHTQEISSTVTVAEPSATVDDVTVSGSTATAITAAETTITLTNNKFTAMAANDDVSGWFTNLPAGLSAKIITAVTANDTAATVVFSGTPTEVSSAAMTIRIPADKLDVQAGLTVTTNADAKWDIVLGAASAVVGNVTVSGTTGTAITASQEATITLTNDNFNTMSANADVSGWFTNRPDGLSAKIKTDVAANDTQATVVFSGTPTAINSDAMTIRIPAANLLRNADLTVTSNPNAMWAVVWGTASAAVGAVTVNGSTGNDLAANQTATITLTSDKFNTMSAGYDVSGWFTTNLPAGVSANIQTNVVANAASATIVFSGIPTAASSAEMAITIPAANLLRNANLTVTSNSNAKWNISAATASAAVGNVTVNGTTNLPMAAGQEATITLTNDKFNTMSANDDVSGWFTNLPDGVSAKIKTAVAANAASATIVFSGTPTAINSDAMTICILAANLVRNTDLTVTSNASAKWAIVWGTASAAVGAVTVNGTTNLPITAGQTATVTLTNDKFNTMSADADVSGWFTNLPTGLSAKIKTAVAANAATATVEFSGTPTAINSDAMTIHILAANLVRNTDLTVTTNASAKWAITPIPVPPIDVTTDSFVQGRAPVNEMITVGSGIAGFDATTNFDFATLGGHTLDLGAVNDTVGGADGSVADGSILIHLNQSYLNTLAVGTHTLTVHLEGGAYAGMSVEIPITVTARPIPPQPYYPTDNPATGDTANVAVWAFVAIIAAGAIVVCIRKRTSN